jgi:DNA-binding PadR family transcriptional regulator
MSSIQNTDSREGKDKENAGRGASARNANPVYELFVLSELMMGPQHGYRLPVILQRILGPFHRLSWGTLYPLIRRLEQQGLITSESEPEARTAGAKLALAHSPTPERGQPRKIYAPTDAGRTRFFALMLDPGEYTSDYPDLFVIKLSKFSLLTPSQQLTVLQQYREYLHILRAHYHTGSQQVLTNPGIGDAERPYILQIADHHIHRCDAELAWLDKRIASLTTETEKE